MGLKGMAFRLWQGLFCLIWYWMERGAWGVWGEGAGMDEYYKMIFTMRKKRFDSDDQRIVWREAGFIVPKRISLSPIKHGMYYLMKKLELLSILTIHDSCNKLEVG